MMVLRAAIQAAPKEVYLMSTILQKLSSRKLWMAIAGIATGILLALGGSSSDIQSVAGAITALASAVTYIITEGRVDAERIKNAVVATQAAVDAIAGTAAAAAEKTDGNS